MNSKSIAVFNNINHHFTSKTFAPNLFIALALACLLAAFAANPASATQLLTGDFIQLPIDDVQRTGRLMGTSNPRAPSLTATEPEAKSALTFGDSAFQRITRKSL